MSTCGAYSASCWRPSGTTLSSERRWLPRSCVAGRRRSARRISPASHRGKQAYRGHSSHCLVADHPPGARGPSAASPGARPEHEDVETLADRSASRPSRPCCCRRRDVQLLLELAGGVSRRGRSARQRVRASGRARSSHSCRVRTCQHRSEDGIPNLNELEDAFRTSTEPPSSLAWLALTLADGRYPTEAELSRAVSRFRLDGPVQLISEVRRRFDVPSPGGGRR